MKQKMLWVAGLLGLVVAAQQMHAGMVRYGDMIKIKHEASGRYLVRNGETDGNKAEVQFLTSDEIKEEKIPLERLYWFIEMRESERNWPKDKNASDQYSKIIDHGDVCRLYSLPESYMLHHDHGQSKTEIDVYNKVVEDNDWIVEVDNSDGGPLPSGGTFFLKHRKYPAYYLSQDGNSPRTYTLTTNRNADFQKIKLVAESHFSMFHLTHGFAVKEGKIQVTDDGDARDDSGVVGGLPDALLDSEFKEALSTLKCDANAPRKIYQKKQPVWFVSVPPLCLTIDNNQLRYEEMTAGKGESFVISRKSSEAADGRSRFIVLRPSSLKYYLQYDANNDKKLKFLNDNTGSFEQWLVVPRGNNTFSLMSRAAIERKHEKKYLGRPNGSTPAKGTSAAVELVSSIESAFIFSWTYEQLESQGLQTKLQERMTNPCYGDVIQLAFGEKEASKYLAYTDNRQSVAIESKKEDEEIKRTTASLRTVGLDDSVTYRTWWMIVPKDQTQFGQEITSGETVFLYNVNSKGYCFNPKGSDTLLIKPGATKAARWKISINEGLLSFESNNKKLNIESDSWRIADLLYYDDLVTYGSSVTIQHSLKANAGWVLASDLQKYTHTGSSGLRRVGCTATISDEEKRVWVVRPAHDQHPDNSNGMPVLAGDHIRFELKGAKEEDGRPLYLRSQYSRAPITADQKEISLAAFDDFGDDWLVKLYNGLILSYSYQTSGDSSADQPLSSQASFIHVKTIQGLHAHAGAQRPYSNSKLFETTGYYKTDSGLDKWQLGKLK